MSDNDETTSLLSRKRSQIQYVNKPHTVSLLQQQEVSDINVTDRDGLIKENTGKRVWSESYSSIDWIHDRIKEGLRKKNLQHFPGYRGHIARASDASQAWILVILIGAFVAAIAWCIDVIQEWMSDLKIGYCSDHWKSNIHTCNAWHTWSEVFGVQGEYSIYYTALFMYTAVSILFSFIAAVMVKFTGDNVNFYTSPTSVPFSKSPSIVSNLEDCASTKEKTPAYESKTVYYSAGSGIPEVKVILGGFVIKGFLGIKTLIVKSIGMIFSTSAGLTLGKEGPFVHLACSAGNIACQLFPKYNKNESKKREVLSASTAAGVSAAFGAPIGGILFSLEEVSYYFPMKTMIRSYCCAMIAAVVLKISDPYGTGKIVLFQVKYNKEYYLFELVPLIICGGFAGFFGAFMTFLNIKYQQLRRNSLVGRYPICEVLCIALITSLVNFWNPWSRMSLSKFAAHLFSECSPTDNNSGLCATTVAEIPQLLYLLLTTLIIKIGLTIITFGSAVPGGVFLPSLIIGAVTGRIIGLIMQYLTLTYPNAWPFSACAQDVMTNGECIVPGIYAIVGAAAGLAGVTRTTVSLVVIMFELTYSLTYALPIMIAVMVAKWVADGMFLEGIYDLLIELKQYPYLASQKEYIHNSSIKELAEQLSTIDIDKPITLGNLKHKLSILKTLGYGEDGGFPILSQGDILEGYISVSEVIHVIEKLENNLSQTMNGHEINQLTCVFSQRVNDNLEPDNDRIKFPDQSINSFSQYIDHAPLTINYNASMTLLLDMFTKLGAQYVCVTRSNGHYLGIIHKRHLLTYLRELHD